MKENKPLHSNHRQRMKNKFKKFGLDAFSDHEVLEFLLYFSIPRIDVNPIAHRLLDRFGSLSNVLDADISALKEVDGIGDNSAILVNLFASLKTRYNLDKKKVLPINSSSAAKNYCRSLYPDFNEEYFFVICLNGKNKVITSKLIKSGNLNRIDINIRDISEFAIKNNCGRIIISHCHTTTNCLPSDEDLTFTRTIICSCMLNDIDVVDHIIVSPEGESSFAELNLINSIKLSAYKTLPLPNKDSIKPSSFESENYIVNN
ncbi:MAG: hypothetical protein J5689_02110 [Clostridia bacterium]|nr:hypothetical protein [Clostridia bacterium]